MPDGGHTDYDAQMDEFQLEGQLAGNDVHCG